MFLYPCTTVENDRKIIKSIMSFVKLENLNDFIQPSSSCIKPVPKKTPGVVAKVTDINLSDCLACSGCITSAESVLVQQQTHEGLFNVINDNKISKTNKEIVVSLSLQSISSLAYRYSIPAQEAAERLASFFISLGCHKVYDINLARHLALVESNREYALRSSEKKNLPIISSICPGWICYAEKTNGDLIIPHLSKVRSPQQIMGALLKDVDAKQRGKHRDEIYHVTIMPCFDKKLEASRNDFKAQDGSQDVDCVLTPVELEEILNDEGVSLLDFDRVKLNVLCDNTFEPLSSHNGSTSGGYAENILTTQSAGDTKLELSASRNRDFIEVNQKFAIINGFRNIQTVVQRLKRNALKYDYIEVMACPSGCINGGAQCRPNPGDDQMAATQATKQIYEQVGPIELPTNADSEKVSKLYENLGLGDDITRKRLLYTDFHPVPKLQNLTVNW